MADASKDPFVEAVDSSSPDSKGEKKDSAEGAADSSFGDPAKDMSRDSAGDAAGKSPASANARGSEEPALDQKMQKLIEAKIDARLESLLEAELEPLLAVNRQVALFLREHLENMIELRHSVRAMEQLLAADPRRKGKYAAVLEKVKGEGAGEQDPHWINRTRGMLSRLERAGTLGPKHDDGPVKA